MFHHHKFLNWCGKNYCNYNKYFSYNFSSLVWKHFAPTVGAKPFHTTVFGFLSYISFFWFGNCSLLLGQCNAAPMKYAPKSYFNPP